MDPSSIDVVSWSWSHVVTFEAEISYILGSWRLLVGGMIRAFFVTECMVAAICMMVGIACIAHWWICLRFRVWGVDPRSTAIFWSCLYVCQGINCFKTSIAGRARCAVCGQSKNTCRSCPVTAWRHRVHFLSGYCRCADLWGLGECVGIAGLFCVRIRNIYFVGNFPSTWKYGAGLYRFLARSFCAIERYACMSDVGAWSRTGSGCLSRVSLSHILLTVCFR